MQALVQTLLNESLVRTLDRSLSTADASELRAFLDDAARPDDTLRFHELQGFLFAIASSPETISPSEWLPMIGYENDLVFASESEAQNILGHVMALYNEVNTAVLERSNALPSGCAFEDDISLNFEESSPISQWSRGFAVGHDWLAEIWEEYLFGELDEECGATLMVLSFFGSRQLAEAYYKEASPGRRKKGDTTFEDFAGTMRKMFPDALASYAHLGRTIFEVVSERGERDREPARSAKVARNEPCPCGSGKKYKKYCGGQLH